MTLVDVAYCRKDACYAPARLADEKDLKLKAQLFHERKPTVRLSVVIQEASPLI